MASIGNQGYERERPKWEIAYFYSCSTYSLFKIFPNQVMEWEKNVEAYAKVKFGIVVIN